MGYEINELDDVSAEACTNVTGRSPLLNASAWWARLWALSLLSTGNYFDGQLE
jgi:hypothetical protein